MAKQFEKLGTAQRAFIEKQRIFFVASAAAGTRINLSPKGLDCLRVIDDNQVAWLDLSGSGAETAAHLAADGRLTLMFCAFEGPPMILRLYGRGRSLLRGTADYAALLDAHFGGSEMPGARQIVLLAFDLVQSSCGYAVPFMDFAAERSTLTEYWTRKTPDELAAYNREKNAHSLDGLPTGFGPG